MVLATQGQDFITPSLCWTLINHICRTSQALGLHDYPRPVVPPKPDNETKQFMFWCVFMTDKVVSLAFGRPAFMTGPLYESTPFPDLHQLTKFDPHTNRLPVPSDEITFQTHATGFGAIYLLQFIKLSKLESRILHFLHHSERSSSPEITSMQWLLVLKKELDEWRSETCDVSQNHGLYTLVWN
jgi:Fungal specific transcription factor domain